MVITRAPPVHHCHTLLYTRRNYSSSDYSLQENIHETNRQNTNTTDSIHYQQVATAGYLRPQSTTWCTGQVKISSTTPTHKTQQSQFYSTDVFQNTCKNRAQGTQLLPPMQLPTSSSLTTTLFLKGKKKSVILQKLQYSEYSFCNKRQ